MREIEVYSRRMQVAVMKPDGSVRVCGDYKVTLNSCLEVNQRSLPRIEECSQTINGGKKFTKYHAQAYNQVHLDEASRELTVYQHSQMSVLFEKTSEEFRGSLQAIRKIWFASKKEQMHLLPGLSRVSGTCDRQGRCKTS